MKIALSATTVAAGWTASGDTPIRGLVIVRNQPCFAELLRLSQYLLFGGKGTTHTSIRVEYLAIYCDLEDATVPLSQLCSNAELVLDCGRQTGGRIQETSLDAVGDLDARLFL